MIVQLKYLCLFKKVLKNVYKNSGRQHVQAVKGLAFMWQPFR